MKTFLPEEQEATLAPHAELTLLFHHLKNADTAPFSYVAVSKLWCLLCSNVFDACRQCPDNDGGGLKLWVRGCHSELCYPWQPPTMGFPNHLILTTTVREALWETLVRIDSAWLTERNDIRVRTFSDSTNQSGAKQYLGPNDECFAEALDEEDRSYADYRAQRHRA